MVDVISQFLTSGSKLTDAIELFGTDFELANISIATILVTLLTAAVCGAVIYLVYRFFNRSVIYNENFNILVILTTIVTSFIIMTISSNVVLSLGMVGAFQLDPNSGYVYYRQSFVLEGMDLTEAQFAQLMKNIETVAVETAEAYSHIMETEYPK